MWDLSLAPGRTIDETQCGQLLGTQSLTGSVSNYHVACGKPRLWAGSQLGCFTCLLLLEGSIYLGIFPKRDKYTGKKYNKVEFSTYRTKANTVL